MPPELPSCRVTVVRVTTLLGPKPAEFHAPHVRSAQTVKANILEYVTARELARPE